MKMLSNGSRRPDTTGTGESRAGSGMVRSVLDWLSDHKLAGAGCALALALCVAVPVAALSPNTGQVPGPQEAQASGYGPSDIPEGMGTEYRGGVERNGAGTDAGTDVPYGSGSYVLEYSVQPSDQEPADPVRSGTAGGLYAGIGDADIADAAALPVTEEPSDGGENQADLPPSYLQLAGDGSGDGIPEDGDQAQAWGEEGKAALAQAEADKLKAAAEKAKAEAERLKAEAEKAKAEAELAKAKAELEAAQAELDAAKKAQEAAAQPVQESQPADATGSDNEMPAWLRPADTGAAAAVPAPEWFASVLDQAMWNNPYDGGPLCRSSWAEIPCAETDGTRAYALLGTPCSQLTQGDILGFAGTAIRNCGADWFTVIGSDGWGIQFPGCNTDYAVYGPLDDCGRVTAVVRHIFISADGYFAVEP